MQAVEIREHGGPEVLRVETVPVPEPGPGNLLVRVAAAGINFTDIGFREGTFTRPLPCDSARRRQARWRRSAPA